MTTASPREPADAGATRRRRTPMRSPAPGRLALLSGLAALLGLGVGGVAWVLVHLIGAMTNLALFGRMSWDLPSLADLDPSPRTVIAAATGGLIVSLLALWAPQIRGHGIPETMEAVLTRQSRIRPRAALAKPLSAAVAIGTGGPFGAEGPIIVTGGALGSMVGQVLPVSPSERKILLASGAAAGMAAVFGVPLAAVVLAIELLLFEFSVRALVPLVVATSLAGGVHSALFEAGPLFSVPPHDFAGLDKLPIFVLLGLVSGLVAAVITRGLRLTEVGFSRLPVPLFWHPVIGGVAFASVGLVVPQVLGVGYDVITGVLNDQMVWTTVAVVAAAKLAAWWVALASGTSGGTVAPMLLISGCTGSLFGHAVAQVVDIGIAPSGFALVAMAATFGAAVRAPFTAIVFLFELTRDYEIILPLMLATVVAELVGQVLLTESLMTEKLSRSGMRVPADYALDPLATTRVRQVMSRHVETVLDVAPIGEALDRLRSGKHRAYPVVDGDGALAGIVADRDLLRGDVDTDAEIRTVAAADVVTIRPSDSVLVALDLMLSERVDHLPVVDDGRLVGICSRTDVLRARWRQIDEERRQVGRASRPGRRSRPVRVYRSGRGRAPWQRWRAARSTRSFLVVGSESLSSEALRDALDERIDQGPCRVHVVAPTSRSTEMRAGPPASGIDDLRTPRDQVEQRLEDLLDWLRREGAEATGELGDPDPFTATQHALAGHRVDEVVLSTLPASASRWLDRDLLHRVQRAVDVPVTHVAGGPDIRDPASRSLEDGERVVD